MSVQILLQGRLFGNEAFLLAGEAGELETLGRCHWVSLLSEVLPRALIAELGLSKMLLGSSGGDQFLVVLPSEVRPQVEEFLENARAATEQISGGHLRLRWAITENLGDWTIVRKRLSEEMQRKTGTPLAGRGFEMAAETSPIPAEYFADFGARIRDAATIGWSPESPASITIGEAKHSWPIGSGPAASADAIPVARHTALADDDHQPANQTTLAARSQGRAVWGVLRGDIDSFSVRIRRAQTIEEHVQLSTIYKQFLAGELEVLSSIGEFWRKITLIYSGGDDFAIYGAWDALIGFARELQRVFQRFAEEQLKDFPGPEGKTLTMAIALAPEPDASLASIFGRAGQRLETAKSTDKDCIYLFGRVIEWKQLSESAEIKDGLTRMVTEFSADPQYIHELCGIYRETRRAALPGEKTGRRYERPWRFHRRLNRILGTSRSRDYQKARTGLVQDLAGKNPANIKLRPSGRVALEWARLATSDAADTQN